MKRHRAPRDWVGETVAIVASGPSVREVDFRSIEGLKTLAVKDGFLLVPNAEALLIGDHRYAARNPDLSAYKGPLIIYTDPRPLPAGLRDPRVAYMPKEAGGGLSSNPGALRGTYTTTCLAINYAVLRGATRLLLFGIDGKPGPNNERHFTGTAQEDWPTRYDRQRFGYERMARALGAEGVKAYNMNPDSAVTCFPKGELP